jgi:hypothetical protein
MGWNISAVVAGGWHFRGRLEGRLHVESRSTFDVLFVVSRPFAVPHTPSNHTDQAGWNYRFFLSESPSAGRDSVCIGRAPKRCSEIWTNDCRFLKSLALSEPTYPHWFSFVIFALNGPTTHYALSHFSGHCAVPLFVPFNGFFESHVIHSGALGFLNGH